MRIEVEITRVYLIVEEKRERLTKAVAKQLPILSHQARWRAAEKGLPQPDPSCKVRGATLGSSHDWLYLVQDQEAGLAWVGAVVTSPEYAQSIIRRGGWVDVPASVPTAIL